MIDEVKRADPRSEAIEVALIAIMKALNEGQKKSALNDMISIANALSTSASADTGRAILALHQKLSLT